MPRREGGAQRRAVTLAPSKVRHDTSVPERRSSSVCAPRALVEGAARAATTSPLRSCRDELWARGNKAENALHLLGRPCALTRVLLSCPTPTCALGAHRPKGCPG